MNSSIVAVIPFSPFISLFVARLDQLKRLTVTEDLELLFESIKTESRNRKKIPVYINGKKETELEFDTNVNISSIRIEIKRKEKFDITMFRKYLDKIKTIMENNILASIVNRFATSELIIEVIIEEVDSGYSLTFYVVADGRKIVAKKIVVSSKELSFKDLRDSDNIIEKRDYKLENRIKRFIDYYHELISLMKLHSDKLNERLRRKTNRLYNVDKLIEYYEEILEKIDKSDNFKDKIVQLLVAREYLKTIEKAGFDIKEIKDLARSIKLEYYKLAADYTYLSSIFEIIKAIVMYFVKPFIIIFENIKGLINAFLNMIRRRINKQSGNIDTNNAKIFVSNIAKLEFYSIVYENSLIGKISSIVRTIFRLLKNIISKGYKAISDLFKWIQKNAINIFSLIVKGSFNILRKASNVIDFFKKRFNNL